VPLRERIPGVGGSAASVRGAARLAPLERKRGRVPPDALPLEVVPRGPGGVPHLEQAAAVVAGEPDVVERRELAAAGDTLQPDAVVGTGGGGGGGDVERETHYRRVVRRR